MGEFCLFCHRRPRAPDRHGLCLVCAVTPLVPQRVAIRSTGRQEVRRLPKPTAYLPGTAGKVLVLEWRQANGYHLWHPLDPRTAVDQPTRGLTHAEVAPESGEVEERPDGTPTLAVHPPAGGE